MKGPGREPTAVLAQGAQYHPSVTVPHDPNNDVDEDAIKYWLQFSDFYVWPHIQTYDSWEDLVREYQDRSNS
jgi:hypothetical protein